MEVFCFPVFFLSTWIATTPVIIMSVASSFCIRVSMSIFSAIISGWNFVRNRLPANTNIDVDLVSDEASDIGPVLSAAANEKYARVLRTPIIARCLYPDVWFRKFSLSRMSEKTYVSPPTPVQKMML